MICRVCGKEKESFGKCYGGKYIRKECNACRNKRNHSYTRKNKVKELTNAYLNNKLLQRGLPRKAEMQTLLRNLYILQRTIKKLPNG